MWRYSRPSRREDPEQGWKIHVSATLMNAHWVLERVAPPLLSRGTQFKAPSSLAEVGRLNAGVYYSYSQVGKVITVYPRSDEEAVLLARQLHKLTCRLAAPSIPFDTRYSPNSNVFYRYGAFKAMDLILSEGARVPAIKDSQGSLTPDLCEPGKAEPEWVLNPFKRKIRRQSVAKVNLSVPRSLRVFRALAQRGKGGVYQALDLSGEPKAGELGWDGRDGSWRVRHEERVLSMLRQRGLDVPRVYSSFEVAGNYYLVTEFIEGECLQSFLLRQRRRMPIPHVLRIAIQLSRFIAEMHVGGWVWRDCKPANLIITKRRELRTLDFEGASPIDRPSPIRWMTPAFSPSRKGTLRGERSAVDDDLYALGAVIYLLLTGKMPDSNAMATPISSLRRNVPDDLCEIVSLLLDSRAQDQLDAANILDRLTKVFDGVRSKLDESHLAPGPKMTVAALGVGGA